MKKNVYIHQNKLEYVGMCVQTGKPTLWFDITLTPSVHHISVFLVYAYAASQSQSQSQKKREGKEGRSLPRSETRVPYPHFATQVNASSLFFRKGQSGRP